MPVSTDTKQLPGSLQGKIQEDWASKQRCNEVQTAKGLKDPRESKQSIGPSSRELGQEQVRSEKQESHGWMPKENEGEKSSPTCP